MTEEQGFSLNSNNIEDRVEFHHRENEEFELRRLNYIQEEEVAIKRREYNAKKALLDSSSDSDGENKSFRISCSAAYGHSSMENSHRTRLEDDAKKLLFDAKSEKDNTTDADNDEIRDCNMKCSSVSRNFDHAKRVVPSSLNSSNNGNDEENKSVNRLGLLEASYLTREEDDARKVLLNSISEDDDDNEDDHPNNKSIFMRPEYDPKKSLPESSSKSNGENKSVNVSYTNISRSYRDLDIKNDDGDIEKVAPLDSSLTDSNHEKDKQGHDDDRTRRENIAKNALLDSASDDDEDYKIFKAEFSSAQNFRGQGKQSYSDRRRREYKAKKALLESGSSDDDSDDGGILSSLPRRVNET